MRTILVAPYDPAWPGAFATIKDELASTLSESILGIEHVGSTSVPGLAAKPVIDIDVVIKDYSVFELVKMRLAAIGYRHEGNLGIKDRQAFKYEGKEHLLTHHLYVCPAYSEELKRHIAFRDALRANPEARAWYAEAKMLAAKHYPHDIDAYITVKGPCIQEILEKYGYREEA